MKKKKPINSHSYSINISCIKYFCETFSSNDITVALNNYTHFIVLYPEGVQSGSMEIYLVNK